MTIADLLATLDGLPDDTEIIIHAPPRRTQYQSIRSLSFGSFRSAETVDGYRFAPTLCLTGAE